MSKKKSKLYLANQQKANFTLMYNIFGTLLPFLVGFIFIILFSFYSDIIKIIDRGDFFIYSSGLLTSTIISFMNSKKSLKNNHKTMHHTSYLLILLSALFFAGVILRDSFQLQFNINIIINNVIIRVMSFVMLIISIWFLKIALDFEFLGMPPETDVQQNEEQRKNQLVEGL